MECNHHIVSGSHYCVESRDGHDRIHLCLYTPLLPTPSPIMARRTPNATHGYAPVTSILPHCAIGRVGGCSAARRRRRSHLREQRLCNTRQMTKKGPVQWWRSSPCGVVLIIACWTDRPADTADIAGMPMAHPPHLTWAVCSIYTSYGVHLQETPSADPSACRGTVRYLESESEINATLGSHRYS
jgi:hypothetical protein